MTKIPPSGGIFAYFNRSRRNYCREGRAMKEKEDEKKPITWEAADPKLPVIQSGHFENQKRN